jgi:hypothetical protein
MAKLRVDKIAAPIVKDEFTGSVYFDGYGSTAGGYLEIPKASFQFLHKLTDSWTVECWVYKGKSDQGTIFDTGGSSSTTIGTAVYINSDNTLRLRVRQALSATVVSENYTIADPVHKWNHFALSFDGSKFRIFWNGVSLGEVSYSTESATDSTQELRIGVYKSASGFSGYWNGYISNFRICKGHAVYTGNFTVPTRELPVHTAPPKGVVFPAADNRTVLLACQDAYNPLTDATGRHTITGAGNLGGVPGQNLVTNGDFVTDVSGWTALNSTTSVSSGQVTITNSGASNGRITSTAFDTVVGARYALKYRAITSGGSYRAEIRESNGVGAEQAFESTTDYSTETFFFTATHTQHTVVLYSIGADGVATIYDYVSVSAVHPVTEANPGLLRKTNITSTITENTGSVFFDGTGDYLDIGKSGDFNFLHNGATDWSVEFWAYTGTATRQFVWGTAGSSAQTGFYLQIMSAADAQSDATGIYAAVTRGAAGNAIGWGADNCLTVNTWHHIAASFKSSDKTLALYVDGREVDNDAGTVSGTFAVANYSSSNHSYALTVGKNKHGNSNFINGYISNVRICKGHAVYKSQFIPPIRELEVHPETVLLACYDGENIFADKTGRHIIAAYGDRTSSPTPTATDSPIGSTTVTPGLTREVDPTEGPTFGGGAGFTSQNWLTLPKGTTTDRNRTGGRGLFFGGYAPSPAALRNIIDYVTISSQGNAQDFGDLLSINNGEGGNCASSTRALAGGGQSNSVDITYVTISSTSNVVDFGDLITGRRSLAGASSSTRGVFAGGTTPDMKNEIEYVTIATFGNALDFGNLTVARRNLAPAGSPTRGVFAGGNPGSSPNTDDTIDYITFASTGDATDFGNLSGTYREMGGTSSSTRALFGGGGPGSSVLNTIEYVTIATTGNTQDFGDLSLARSGTAGLSNKIRGVFGGGSSPTYQNLIDFVTIASTGDAADFGDLTAPRFFYGAASDSHGGIS